MRAQCTRALCRRFIVILLCLAVIVLFDVMDFVQFTGLFRQRSIQSFDFGIFEGINGLINQFANKTAIELMDDAIIQSTNNYSINESPKPLFIQYSIMSMKELAKERNMIRNILSMQYEEMNKEKEDDFDFDYTFVIGEKYPSEELLNEMDLYQDITILNITENMNDGKTYEYFKHVYNHNQKDEYENYLVFKADMDSMLCLEKFVEDLLVVIATKESEYLYYGSHCGSIMDKHHWIQILFDHLSQKHCGIYMCGGLYGLSMPLIEKIFEDDRAYDIRIGHEDLLVAKWINQTDVRNEVQVVARKNCEFWCHQKILKPSQDGWTVKHYEEMC